MSRISPADVVSVESDSISYLFFVNEKGIISSLKGPAGGVESEDAGFYKKEAIYLFKKDEDGNEISGPVKTHVDLKQIAAVAYQDSQGYQIRLYYGQEGTLKLKELCRTNGGKWTEGALGRTTTMKMPPKSSISATVHQYSKKLKVYACSDDDINEDGNSEMSCYYVSLGSSDWTRRRVTHEIKY